MPAIAKTKSKARSSKVSTGSTGKKTIKKALTHKKAKATPKTPAVAGIPERKPGEVRYWLMKSEPEAYSIDAFKADGKTLWTGVRNYLARNFMMTAMAKGDRFLFYHSNAEPSGAVGTGRILRTNVPDPSALDSTSDYYDPKASEDHPIWFCAEVGYDGHLARVVTLAEIRAKKELAQMALLQKGQRLSVQLVTEKEFRLIIEMGGGQK